MSLEHSDPPPFSHSCFSPSTQAYNGHCEALGVLSETLVSLDVRDAGGRTALYLAAQKGHAQCLEVLLSHGVSCHLRESRNKWTPLHVAGVCVCFPLYVVFVIVRF